MIKKVVIKDLILSALMMLILVGLLPTTANAGSVVNECKTGAECVDLGFKYITGKDVKQDDFKALKFYQKACDLNYSNHCHNLNHMPFECVVECYFNGVTHSGFERTKILMG